jgi:lipid-binding SYLF domain-containing protein
MRKFARTLSILACLVGMLALRPTGATGAEVSDESQMVNRAVNTIERIRGEEMRKQIISSKLAQARAVLIVPDLVKGGFILGAEYGTGVLLTRDKNGAWTGPAFYSIASGSVGFQIGLQDSETLFVIMSDNGLYAVMNDKMKLGAAADVTLVVVGGGAEASTTTNAGADIYAFGTSVGLFGGVSLEGSGILPRHSWNANYYGGSPTPEDILIYHRYSNPQADRLKDVLGR